LYFKIKSALIALLFCLPLAAQNIELSPHSGFMDGSAEFGADLSLSYSAINLEFSAAQVIGEAADMYPLLVNLVFNLSSNKEVVPYAHVGGGLLLTVPTNAIGSESVSSPGINFGGGLRYYINEKFGLRLGVSQYLTDIRNRRDERKELLIFQEVSLGVIFVIK